MILEKILILKDNYVWIMHNCDNDCIIIDPGNADCIIDKIEKNNWHPIAILLTHWHIDHTGGVLKIKKKYPHITIYGPYETKKYYVNIFVTHGMNIKILKRNFFVLSTPGHTDGHVSYYSKPYIFCGDVLFSGGCGYCQEKKYLDMYNSIKKILYLPNRTLLCCSHEYTLANLKFSLSILPKDFELNKYYLLLKENLLNKSTLPSIINYEKKINLFLRTKEIKLKKSLNMKYNSSSFQVFSRLRNIKNLY